MRKSKFTQKDPLAAAGSWVSASSEGDSEGVEASSAEKRMAVVDVDCKEKVDYVRRRQIVESEYQVKILKEMSVPLESYRAAWNHSLSEARLVLQGS